MKIKRIIDVSRKIHADMTIWPGDSGIDTRRDLEIIKGDPCNLSTISLGLHTGTHIDAPFHFVDKGIKVESLDLTRFIGNAKLFELNCTKAITADDLKDLPINENDIVIFKTANSELPEGGEFQKDFIYIDQTAADFLIHKKIRTVGIDYLSVEKYNSPDHSTHHLLLTANIGIIEGLYLKDVCQGEYFLSCLPLKIEGVEGSPVRAVLLEFED